jgi:hypothetical protein
VAEYAVARKALLEPQAPQSRFTGDSTTRIVQVTVSVLPFLSTTFDVKVKVPAAVGVPEMVPVVVLSVRPGGREPELIE